MFTDVTAARTSGTSVAFQFRAVKNGGLMVDQRITPIDLSSASSNVSFSIPVTAVTNDKFRLQIARVANTDTIEIQSLSVTIQ